MKIFKRFILLLGIVDGNQINETNYRIVGGIEVYPQFKYPWMVSLKKKGRHWCGGAQYNMNTVISAAHCVNGPVSAWSAETHRHKIRLPISEENGRSYQVSKRITHPQYKTSSNAFDVAIWKLEANYGNSANIRLDNGRWTHQSNVPLIVIGWGTTTVGGAVSSVLREVAVPVVSDDECKRVYPKLHTSSQFCAGLPEGGKDSCQGDSGGPIVAFGETGPVLVGVVSWGKGCASKNYPGVYTRISKVIDFINQNAS